ncbi:hypothetical protein Asi03nite_17120 [Actinoplanes siamensis]|uniref:Uncharacterized protein n=1 Tax=Actinoplanes siamensis TaxID=1223317 RepID=A0A919N4C0_9ACTN|nr:hypothetical protein Asi03nite_17120 [Actinoplanes siamensis]
MPAVRFPPSSQGVRHAVRRASGDAPSAPGEGVGHEVKNARMVMVNATATTTDRARRCRGRRNRLGEAVVDFGALDNDSKGRDPAERSEAIEHSRAQAARGSCDCSASSR